MTSDPMERLNEALEIHRRWEEREDREPAAELLERHPQLRKYLEPLLLGSEETEDASAAEERTLGGFRILREVGRGGMGVVYEAVEIALSRRIALKVLPAHLTLQPTAVARFRREALTAAGLDHPGLVKVHAVGSEGGTHFFAMEFVEGAPLSRVVEAASLHAPESLEGTTLGEAVFASRHRLSTGEAHAEETRRREISHSWHRGHIQTVLGLTRQVAEALEHAHRAGVIHRDVKPSNILVREDGTAVLTDFGLARETGVPSMTLTGDFVGTPYYVSPEQAAGRGREIDHRTDVFSLGATLYELLTLKRPFTGESTQEILHAIQSKEPLDPRKHNPRIAPDLAAIVLKALEKDPGRRYPSAAALAEDLEAFLHYRPISARRVSPAARLVRWARREPVKAALLLVLVLGTPLLAGLGGYILAQREKVAFGERLLRQEELESRLSEAFFWLDEAPARADRIFREVLAEEPGQREALMGRALLLYMGDQPADLLAYLDRHREALGSASASSWLRDAAERQQGISRSLPTAKPNGAKTDTPTALGRFFHSFRLREMAIRTGVESCYAEAVRAMRSAILLSPKPRALYYQQLAVLAGPAKDREAAREAEEGLATFWPGRTCTRLYRAIALEEPDPPAALRLFLSIPEGEGRSNHMYLSHLAECHEAMGEGEKAIRVLERDLELHADDPGVTASILYNMGVFFSRSLDNRERAVECYRRAVAADPKHHRAWNNLGFNLIRMRRSKEALEALNEAIRLQPGYVLAHENLALLHDRLRQPDRALEHARQAIALDPGDIRIRRLLGDLHRRRGESAEAEKHLREAAGKPDPSLAPVFSSLGLLHLKRPAEARYWFRRAVEADPDFLFGHLNLAANLAAEKRIEEALPHFRRAVEINPDHLVASKNLIRSFCDLGRVPEARAECRRWLARHPDTNFHWTWLAWLLVQRDLEPGLRDPEEALRCATRAGELARWRDPEHHLIAAEAHRQMNDLHKARVSLAKAEERLAAGVRPGALQDLCREYLEALRKELGE